MLPDIALEALRFFDRSTLEGLQMHSRYLRDFVKLHERTLPLREFRSVTITHRISSPRMQQLGFDRDNILVCETSELGLERRFNLINNSFVHRLSLSFRPEDRPFLYYLREQADDLQCRIGALHLEYLIGENEDGNEGEIEYDVVDFLGAHMKPAIYEMSANREFREDYAMLFTHGALRGGVKHLVYKFEEVSSPVCVIPELFGVNVVESCNIAAESDLRPWISTFIEMFETAERETDAVRSVTLLYMRFGDDTGLPLDLVPLLGQPRGTNIPKPNSPFIDEWLQERFSIMLTPSESRVAELFVFENARSAKKLELFAWTIEERTCYDSLHYAFVLRVIDA